MAGQVGQLLLKGLFITVTLLRFHPSLPASIVTRPHRNNEAHPSRPSPTVSAHTHKYTSTRMSYVHIAKSGLDSNCRLARTQAWLSCRLKITGSNLWRSEVKLQTQSQLLFYALATYRL